MLLTISTTRRPATDLGYLLHKRPDKLQSFELAVGVAHVFYPVASDELCRATLFVEVDPVALVRGGGLDQYVNDRPYVGSSLLSVAIGRVFRSAMAGQSKERAEVAAAALPLTAEIPALPCRGGEALLQRLFEPLGYRVTARRLPLDETVPDWGDSRYHAVEIAGDVRLADLLTHLYVLIPVLDDDKHYWVGDEEVEKLLRHGERWLATHPERELITRRYLKHRPNLTREALSRLAGEEQADPERAQRRHDRAEADLERPLSLNEQRMRAVVDALRGAGAKVIADLGCGEGRLLRELALEKSFTSITGMDVSCRALEVAAKRLRLERQPERQRGRVTLIQGSLTYRDRRLDGLDAAAVVEVIEHLDPPRLDAFERALFGAARPRTVVLTTPNREYNARFEALEGGKLRHADHRFEWTRAEFSAWAAGVAGRCGYAVALGPVGPVDAELGAPTQMAIFTRKDGDA